MESSTTPLRGRRIVLTRATDQAGSLAEALSAFGAEIVHLPMVSFRTPEDTTVLDEAVRGLDTFAWILFTSQNAVRYFCDRCRHLERARPAGLRVAAVGPATAAAARNEGWVADHVARTFRGEALAQELAEAVRGKRVLLPRSNLASAELLEALRLAGAEVVDVLAYLTERPPTTAEAVRAALAGADAICFASPSAVHNFFALLEEHEMESASTVAAIAAIGPVTARAVRNAGLHLQIEAVESTAEALARALAEYFSGDAGGSRATQ